MNENWEYGEDGTIGIIPNDTTLFKMFRNMSIREIAEYYSTLQYATVRFYEDMDLVMFATGGWSDNEHFLQRLWMVRGSDLVAHGKGGSTYYDLKEEGSDSEYAIVKLDKLDDDLREKLEKKLQYTVKD